MTDFLDSDKAHHQGNAQYNEGGEELYEEDYYEDEEDDGLGYYSDGVKRTLTDEQIAMFRHSELQALDRAREKAHEIKINTHHDGLSPVPKAEDGEVFEEGNDAQISAAMSKKKKKSKKKRGSGKGSTKPWSPDPERRKRTWDVVETGLDGLDYGETGTSGSPVEHVAQRRRITYNDG